MHSPKKSLIMNAITKLIDNLGPFKIPIFRFILLIIGLLLVFITQAQTGNVCETPLQITQLPYSHTANTSTYGNDYDYFDVPPIADNAVTSGTFAPNYLGAFDVVYAYTPSQDDYVDAFLLGNGDLSALWVFTGCPFEFTLGWDLFYNDEEREVLTIPVLAGQTYYFVLSSYPNNPSYSYTFELHESPDFDCPALANYYGNTCDDNNSLTINDVITSDCNCEGMSIDASANFLLPSSLQCGFRNGKVDFYEPGTANLIMTKYGYSLNNAIVMQANQIPVGTFDLYIEVEGMLREKMENYTTSSGVNTIYIVDVIVGDMDNNNSINLLDVSIFSNGFGKTIDSPEYNFLANLNCDASINILDFSILSANFGMQGVSQP